MICTCINSRLPNYSSQLTEEKLELRTPTNYDHMCHVLSTSGDSSETTTYGINRQSELNRLQYYHVCDYGLPPDVMHDLLEGYLPYTLKLLLSHFIHDENIEVTLQRVNAAIENVLIQRNLPVLRTRLYPLRMDVLHFQ